MSATIGDKRGLIDSLPYGDATQVEILRTEYNRGITIAFNLEKNIKDNCQYMSDHQITQIELKAAAWRAIALEADEKIQDIVFSMNCKP